MPPSRWDDERGEKCAAGDCRVKTQAFLTALRWSFVCRLAHCLRREMRTDPEVLPEEFPDQPRLPADDLRCWQSGDQPLNGIILVTAPPGLGKTITLYTMLANWATG